MAKKANEAVDVVVAAIADRECECEGGGATDRGRATDGQLLDRYGDAVDDVVGAERQPALFKRQGALVKQTQALIVETKGPQSRRRDEVAPGIAEAHLAA